MLGNNNLVKKILWVRTDSIGDGVLAASMLSHIKEAYKQAKIIVVCQQPLVELYAACPFVDDVIGFDKKHYVTNFHYKQSILQLLRELQIDLALNSVFSRELSMDCLATEIEAKETVAFKVLKRRSRFDFVFCYNRGYSQLINSKEAWKPELERHKDFVKGLGIAASSLSPCIWTTPDDEMFADNFFREQNLDKDRTIALFAGALSEHRLYQHYGAALAKSFPENNSMVIAFGAQKDFAINEKNLNDLRCKTINLCGKTTLRQTAALFKRCRLALGAETGLAHIACAVGLPNIILLGGGHFGRFMPYSPLTSAVIVPLDCFGCDWKCKYKETYCVSKIMPDVLAYAIKQTLQKLVARPRIFIQQAPETHELAWQLHDRLLDFKTVEISRVEDVL